MTAKKKTHTKKRSTISQLGPEASATVQYLVVTFTVLSIVYVYVAYWRYG